MKIAYGLTLQFSSTLVFDFIVIESRITVDFALVWSRQNIFLISRCPKSNIRAFKESDRSGTRITGELIDILMATRGDFSTNCVIAFFAFSVTASDASRTFLFAAWIWLSSSFTSKLAMYSCLKIVLCKNGKSNCLSVRKQKYALRHVKSSQFINLKYIQFVKRINNIFSLIKINQKQFRRHFLFHVQTCFSIVSFYCNCVKMNHL